VGTRPLMAAIGDVERFASPEGRHQAKTLT
jgi:hypothetical protein